MRRVGNQPAKPDIVDRRLLAEADRLGNADGVASVEELEAVAETLESTPSFDITGKARREKVQSLLGQAVETPPATLDPTFQSLPEPLRRLALEMDSLWGDANGQVSVEEFGRVVEFTLSALPFFTDDAGALLELAQHLGFDKAESKAAPSVMKLQMALAQVDSQEVESNRPFRQMFDEAVAHGEQSGAPELLRDALLHSPRWHRFSILDHTAKAVEAVRDLSQAVGMEWKNAGASMLLHDVGKILERNAKSPDSSGNPRFHYFDHESAGAEWLESRGLDPDIAFHVRNHAEIRKRSNDEILALAEGNPNRLAEMVVVYVADQVAKGNTSEQMESFATISPRLLHLAEKAGIDGEVLLQRASELRADFVERHETFA